MKRTIVVVAVLGLLMIGGSIGLAQTTNNTCCFGPGIETSFQFRAFGPCLNISSFTAGLTFPDSQNAEFKTGFAFSRFRIDTYKQDFVGIYSAIGTRGFDVLRASYQVNFSLPETSDTIIEVTTKLPLPMDGLMRPGLVMYLGGDYLHELVLSEGEYSTFDTYGPLVGLNMALFTSNVTLRFWAEADLLWSFDWIPTFTIGLDLIF